MLEITARLELKVNHIVLNFERLNFCEKGFLKISLTHVFAAGTPTHIIYYEFGICIQAYLSNMHHHTSQLSAKL